ncbi:hypothetical protein HDV02_001092, partial [Globomyces sp. JEL0801]
MRAAGSTWRLIGIDVGKTATAVQVWHHGCQKNSNLPPRDVVRKRKTGGRVALAITKIVRDKPTISVRDIEGELANQLGPESRIP